MPTVSNRDINGHWNEHKDVGEVAFPSKRFKEGHDLNVLPSTFTSAADHIAEEHGYAVTQRFVSSNSYYGYHPVMTIASSEEFSMDTSENTPNVGSTQAMARKRCLEGEAEFDSDMASKRGRYERSSELPPPLPSYQEPPEQQQLPGNTSYLMESMMPRPRCLMGHYV